MNDCLLVIMAKYPTRGRVKTRLAASLGQARAARVYRGLIEHHLREFARTPYSVEWRCSPPRAPFRRLLGSAARWQPQPDGHLGERMAQIFAEAFEGGYRRVVMIGTDAPTMDQPTVEQAFDLLRSMPAVFQPTEDGGYALIGLTALLNVFSGIDWSTSRVMAQTRAGLGRHRIPHGELDATYDIDTAADLERWRREQPGAAAAAGG